MLLDDLNPIERLAIVAQLLDEGKLQLLQSLRPLQLSVEAHRSLNPADFETSAPFCRLLDSLNAVDRVLQSVTGSSAHHYLLGDDQALVAQELCGTVEPISSVRPELEILASCGLIYRFNVALKFECPARGVNQLRINAWGRAFCDRLRGKAQCRVEEAIGEVLRPYEQEYRVLIALCESEARPLDVGTIHRINAMVPLKVVT